MSIEKALDCILESNLEGMKSSINSVLSEKAVEKIEEMKTTLAQNIFENSTQE